MRFSFNPFENPEKREERVIQELKKKNPTPVSEKLPGFKPLLDAARAQKNETTETQDKENFHRERNKNPWGVYRYNMEDYFDMYPTMKSMKPNIVGVISNKHAEGKKVVALDLLGEASGKNMGFDTTITFSLTKLEKGRKSVKSLSGDIFSPAAPGKLREAFSETDGDLIFVHCDPIAGLIDFANTEDENRLVYGLRQLENVFDTIYEKLDPSGAMILHIANVLSPYATEKFKDFLKERKVKYRIDSETFIIITK